MKFTPLIAVLLLAQTAFGQIKDSTHLLSDTLKRQDTILIVLPPVYQDTALRIMNLNPYFTIHEDSVVNYDLAINKESKDYFWFIQKSPLGVRLDKKSGNLTIKGDKALFKTGRLKYDIPYQVQIGVQNLHNPTDRVDTSFTILFYSTEVVVSKVKPSTSSIINVEEGDSVQFRVLCDEGSFPLEQISMNTSMPLSNFSTVKKCNDEFKWVVPFGIFRENDTAKVKFVLVDFIGTDKFYNKDTASIRINIKPGINFPVRNLAHKRISDEFENYIKYLKFQFFEVSGKVKRTKKVRTTFDISSSTTAFAGTIISSTSEAGSSGASWGRIMPSVGLTLVPIKEATAPNNIQQQNTATQIRSEARRLEFFLGENQLSGDRDAEVLAKIKRLQDELKKAKLQFLDLDPVDAKEYMNKDIDKFFNDPKVNKKYRIKVK